MSQPEKTPKSFKLHTGKTSLKQIGLILFVALFFIGLVWLGGWGANRQIENTVSNTPNISRQNNDIPKTTPITSLPEIVPVAVTEGEAPEGFPASIPLNGKMNIVESYSEKNSTTEGIVSSTVVFQSSKTLKENQTFYEKWAEENKWQVITNNVDTDDINKDIIHLALSKDNNYLNISLEELLYNTTKVMIVYRPAVDSGLNEMTDEMKEQLRNIRF